MITPIDTYCRCCSAPCTPTKLDNSFDYAGTHCTGGRPGTHYPEGYGSLVSDCCEDEVMDSGGNILTWEDLEVDPY